MRKIFSILLALTLLLCLAAGCGADKTAPSSAVPATSTQTRPDDTAAVPPETEPAIRNDILDQSGNLLGRIDARAVVSAADEGILRPRPRHNTDSSAHRTGRTFFWVRWKIRVMKRSIPVRRWTGSCTPWP